MILVDTSVWIEHLRGSPRAAELQRLLDREQALIHPWVAGELALGNLGPQRQAILDDLHLLPALEPIADSEVRAMIEARHLWSSGLGWVDAGLLAAALASEIGLWTLDGRLAKAAGDAEVRFDRPR